MFTTWQKTMEQISLTPKLEITKITTLEELLKSLQVLMETLPPDTKIFANIKGEVETQVKQIFAYPFLDKDFFDDEDVPSDLSENHDNYLYE